MKKFVNLITMTEGLVSPSDEKFPSHQTNVTYNLDSEV